MSLNVEVARAKGAVLNGGYAYEWSWPGEPEPRSEGFFAPLLAYFEDRKAEVQAERIKLLKELKKYEK